MSCNIFPACDLTEVVVKTAVSNLVTSSNGADVGKLIPGGGDQNNPWSPAPGDETPKVTINLPPVNGVPAGEYTIMEIDLTPGDVVTITVTIKDKSGNPVFVVGVIYLKFWSIFEFSRINLC